MTVTVIGEVLAWRPGRPEPDDWRGLGICAQDDEDPDMWSDRLASVRAQARHRCLTHCPVLAICRAFVPPGSGCTSGGLSYGERNARLLKSKDQPGAQRCPRCDRD